MNITTYVFSFSPASALVVVVTVMEPVAYPSAVAVIVAEPTFIPKVTRPPVLTVATSGSLVVQLITFVEAF